MKKKKGKYGWLNDCKGREKRKGKGKVEKNITGEKKEKRKRLKRLNSRKKK